MLVQELVSVDAVICFLFLARESPSSESGIMLATPASSFWGALASSEVPLKHPEQGEARCEGALRAASVPSGRSSGQTWTRTPGDGVFLKNQPQDNEMQHMKAVGKGER